MIELAWRGGLDESEAVEVRALATAAAAADGTAPLGEQVLLRLRSGDVTHLLARDGGGGLLGVAQLEPAAAAAELVVHPEHRRGGLGRRIVEELLERTGGSLRVWAHGQHPGAVALAARLGFTAVRELWQMRRSLLDPLPEPELPPGVRLRAFVPGQDDEEFLRVNNAAFDWHPEQGGWDLETLRGRYEQPWFDPEGFLLHEREGKLAGFCWTKVHAAHEPPLGEIYVVAVDPGFKGLGLGRELVLAGLDHLAGRGLTVGMLYVDADNAGALRLYEDLGFECDHVDRAYVGDVPARK